MKKLRLLIFFFAIPIAFGQDKKDETDKEKIIKEEDRKIYSKKELEQKIDEHLKENIEKEISKRIKKVLPANLIDFSKELLTREDELNEKLRILKSKEDQLLINEQAFSKRVKKTDDKQIKILGCMEKNENSKQNRIDHIVKVISNMKPVSAAQVLSVQEPDLSVKILGILDAVKAAKIFNLMERDVSARLQKQYLDMKR